MQRSPKHEAEASWLYVQYLDQPVLFLARICDRNQSPMKAIARMAKLSAREGGHIAMCSVSWPMDIANGDVTAHNQTAIAILKLG